MVAKLKHRNGAPTPLIPYADFILDGWRKFAQRVAIVGVEEESEITYGDLESRVFSLAAYFQSYGVTRQSNVQLFCKNSISAVVAQQAAFFCGARVFHFKVNDSIKFDEYKFQTDHGDIEFVITDPHNYDLLAHRLLDASSPRIRIIFVVNGTPTRAISSASVRIVPSDLEGLVFKKPQDIDVKKDVLLVSYTSGSTGNPKGVMHSHHSYISSLVKSRELVLSKENDRFLLLSNLTYASGIILVGNVFAMSCTVILANHGYDAVLPEIIAKHKATNVLLYECTMSLVAENSTKYPNFSQMIESLESVYLGGTVFPDHLRLQAAKLFEGKLFKNGYGLTESIGPLINTYDLDSPAGHVGCEVINIEMRVVRDDGSEVEVGEAGEVQWRGHQMLVGYWKMECDDWTDDGFFATGDLGRIDAEGCLTIVGRKKLFMICLDERVSPTEIEDVVLQHPAVKEVVVVPVPHPVVSQAPTAMVVLKEAYKRQNKAQEATLKKDIVDFVESKVADYKQLHGGVFFVGELDKAETGKYSRPKIEKLALLLSGKS